MVVPNRTGCRAVGVSGTGFSGYNTRWAMYTLNDVFPPTRSPPLFVTVFLGANDATKVEYNSRQHVPLSEYVANLRLIVRHIQAVGSAAHPVQVVLITPPPIDAVGYLTFLKKYPDGESRVDRTLELSGQYAKACVELAAEMGYVATFSPLCAVV